MKKKYIQLLLFLSLIMFPNFTKAQFGIEVNYGLNGACQPSTTNFSHFGGGLLYDFNESFGAKLDFGSNQFKSDNNLLKRETGINITRISLQGTVNISDLIDPNTLYNSFNLSGHVGGGYSLIKSTEFPKTNNTVHAIIGLTPKIKISQGLYFAVDTSVIFNFSQRYTFEGQYNSVDSLKSMTGIMYNVTGGIIYKFNEYY